jgi:hypothetical protein
MKFLSKNSFELFKVFLKKKKGLENPNKNSALELPQPGIEPGIEPGINWSVSNSWSLPPQCTPTLNGLMDLVIQCLLKRCNLNIN